MADVSVLLVDGESPFAMSVVACLAAANVRVHVLSKAQWAPIRVSRHIASFHSTQAASSADAVADLARRHHADICLAADEDAIRNFAGEWRSLAESLPLAPVPPLESFDITVDKWALASFLESRGLPHPPTILCHPGPDLARAVQNMSFPVLLKPRRGGNGAGIVRCNTPAEVFSLIERRPDMSERYVVQTEFAGSDIDCSVLCEDGRVVVHTIQRPIGRAAAQFKPSGAIEFLRDDDVLGVVSRMTSMLRWNGVAHVDLRCNQDGQITIIEVNPRFWGSLHGSLRAGVNFPYLSLLAGLERPLPEVSFRPCQYVAGSAAVQAWLRSLLGAQQAFEVEQTAWAHILHDPAPHLLDLWSA